MVSRARNSRGRWYMFYDMVFGGDCDSGEICVKVLWHWHSQQCILNNVRDKGLDSHLASHIGQHLTFQLWQLVLRIEQVQGWHGGPEGSQSRRKRSVTGEQAFLRGLLPSEKRASVARKAGLRIPLVTQWLNVRNLPPASCALRKQTTLEAKLARGLLVSKASLI